jgi:hypothetical protein
MRIRCLLLSMCWATLMAAQVSVDRPVLLTGAAGSDRQVLGLRDAQIANDALNAASDQAGRAHGTAATAPWSFETPYLTGAPTPGTELRAASPAPQPGNAVLMLNGQGPYAVLLAPGMPLAGNLLPQGTMLSLVFDGTAFQVMDGASHARRSCPEGLVAAGSQYCIEPTEGAASDFYEASVDCVQRGLRLCTWGEWMQACIDRASLGLVNMIGNWEWTNNTANEDLGVRGVGNTSCTGVGVFNSTTTTLTHRCCYSR